jgi:hypothetical protein
MFETERKYYERNREALIGRYCGKYIVISGDRVVAAYDDEDDAYFETVKTIPLGSFMIHHVTDPEEVVNISPVLSGYVL